MKPVPDACPCGSGTAHAACCGRYHAGEAAPDAEALMRSRYSAFVRGDEAYLRASWDPATCPPDLGLDAPGGVRTQWLGLTVKQHRLTGENAAGERIAEVEFVARYRVGGGAAVRLHELSRFMQRDGRWFYVDGDHR
ncbi:YchJ family protein [Pseudoxanthomonas beigongshangi]|uniref:YchJ family protein n=1 Tax=Pseudoxanthomonas beigongshangi TaxID=2782537 RepID=UPI003CCCEA10